MPSSSLRADRRDWIETLRHSPTGLALVAGAVFATIWGLLPPSGSDLAAQVAHADFFDADGWLPVDMRWFGGTDVFGYSVISPPLMALLGVTAFGMVTTIGASGLLGLLLTKCRVPRPRVSALVGAGCLAANLMVGRLTFALGVAFGLATLLCLWIPGRARMPLLALGTVVTWAASPLAALFLAMIGAALVARRRVADGAVLGMTGGLVLLGSAGLGQGGVMPMAADDLVRGLLACALVAFVTRYPVVRIVAGLSALSLTFAYFVDTPVGVNAIRLPAIFAVPVAVATSRLRWRALLPLAVGTLLLIPPMTLNDAVVGQPANERDFFVELNSELAAMPLTGRVEVVPTSDRWEAVYVAGQVPLARGWMTQVDRANNGLFFDPDLMTPERYRRWLHRNSVQYVAVSDAKPAAAGVTEEQLIRTGLPYLATVWQGRHWRLFSVRGATPTVRGATLVSQTSKAISFRAGRSATVAIQVRWSRWLSLDGPDGCLFARGQWTGVSVHSAGLYVLSSALLPGSGHSVCPAR